MKSGEKTKERMAAAFKKLMTQRQFDSITITDITDACGLNRLTFYYHFQDKYDLMNWIFYRDVIMAVRGSVDSENWPDMLYDALKAMKEDSDYYCSSVSYDRVELRKYIYDFSEEIMTAVIPDIAGVKGAAKDDNEFTVRFYSHGLAGVLFDWIRSGMQEDPSQIVKDAVGVFDRAGQSAPVQAAKII